MNKIRQSNFELMRIVSMIFIALWHFILFGKMEEGTSGITNIIIVIIEAIILVHVNSFILLTGYFNYDKKFKLSKVIKINNTMWFYRIICILIFMICFSVSYSKLYIIRTFSPIPRFEDYWFLVVYMLLYLISPLLNMIINGSDKTKHFMIIVGLFIISILGYVTCNAFYNVNGGYSLFSGIFLYFLGAYLHKYPISFKNSRAKTVLLCLVGFAICVAINVIVYKFGCKHLYSHRETVRYYSEVIKSGFSAYSNPLIILCSLFYFIIFSNIKISNRAINFIGKNVLGVYLITQNPLFFRRMYKWLNFDLNAYNYKHILIAIGYSVALVIVYSLIEALRSYLFKLIYDLKTSGKLRDKIKKLFKKVNINW